MPRRDFTRVPFAATGDMNSVPTEAQADGSVSLAQGYTYDYERDNGAGGGTPDPLAKNISREDMNGIFNEITASIGEIQLNGYAVWTASAAPYPINALVRHNSVNWRSVIANNSAEPGVAQGWVNAEMYGGRLLNIRAFTGAAVTYTPTPGTKAVKVIAVGGGGPGGGAPIANSGLSSVGGAGSAGSYAEAYFVSGFEGVTITPGAGGVPAVGMKGTNGGASSFGSLLSAPGGLAAGSKPSISGQDIVSGSGSPGSPTGANIVGTLGARGGPAIVLGPTVGAAGAGGAGYFGLGVGNGGDGQYSPQNTPTATLGIPGGTGIVIVEEYS